jgi:hypothetical protein
MKAYQSGEIYMKSINQILWVSTLSSLLILGGCGGSSNSSSSDNATGGAGTNTGAGTGTGTGTGTNTGSTEIKTVQATVTSSNAKDLGVAAARGIKKAVIDQTTGGALGAEVGSVDGALAEVVNALIKNNQQVVSAVDISAYFCESGTADLTTSQDGLSTTTSYNQCSFSGLTFDGSFSTSSSADYLTTSYQYNNFKVSYANGEYYLMSGSGSTQISADYDRSVTTFSAFTYTDWTGESYSLSDTVITCTGLTTENSVCSYDADWSEGGSSYRIESATVAGDSGSGYEVNVKVYDTTNGYVEVDTTVKVTFNCSNGNPGSGAANFMGADSSSGTVNFDSCTGFTVTVDGVGTTYSWSDI